MGNPRGSNALNIVSLAGVTQDAIHERKVQCRLFSTPTVVHLVEGGEGGSKESKNNCIRRESNSRRIDGNDPGYHYPTNAWEKLRPGMERSRPDP